MNRSQRRQLAKLQRHGITVQDLKNTAKREANSAIVFQNRMFLAATAIALHREFGFGKERCLRALHAIEDIAFEATCAEELREQAIAETGIDIPSETGMLNT